jgi:hypothetical protein
MASALETWQGLHGTWELNNVMSILLSCNSNLLNRDFHRYYGHRAEDQQGKEDLEEMINRTHRATATFIISDYVPFLSFIPKLQGYHSEFKRIYEFETSVTNKVFEVEKHRERAKERLQGHNDEADYVPDFVDVLLASPLGGGEPLSDRSIVTALTVINPEQVQSLSSSMPFICFLTILHWTAIGLGFFDIS